MAISLAHGKRATLSKVDAFADGVAVKSVSTYFLRPTLKVNQQPVIHLNLILCHRVIARLKAAEACE